ncbi:MAG: carboxypeptidase regulatory-like domain-containing protein [candidate division Zixibacteria bacterium]|nr:carboxypeptidase regulatory-like domain-containing protein [candidate division Zixibacteria bacterium]
MIGQLAQRLLVGVIFSFSVLMFAACSDDDNPQISEGRHVVGDTSQAAQLLDIELPADCETDEYEISALSGKLNNVVVEDVKIVLYSTSGHYYGTLRVIDDDGRFSMDLPCGRRVRLLLAKSDWTSDDTLNNGPPALNDSILATYWDIDRIVGTINGSVVDGYNNSLLSDAVVTWVIDGTAGSDTTDANGYFLVPDRLLTGNYLLTYTKDGYAVISQNVYIPSFEEVRGDLDIYPGDMAYVEALTIPLPPLTSSLEGTVCVIEPGTNDTVEVAEVIVDLRLNDEIVPYFFSDTTDAVGLYGFADVPTTDTLTLATRSFDHGPQTYEAADTVLYLMPGTTRVDFLFDVSGGAVIRVETDELQR